MFQNSIGVIYMCVSWKLEITPKTETYHVLFITAWVDDPDLSVFKPFFCRPFFHGLQKLSSGLWSESSQKKSVRETCPNRFCQDDSIQIWNFTNCQFQDMKTYMSLILKKNRMRKKEVPKGSMFMVYLYTPTLNLREM